ncbi:response regulator [Bacteriovoracaceae bacterium]|nr:response regulator [Bacteriovoracaceae bacterium]
MDTKLLNILTENEYLLKKSWKPKAENHTGLRGMIIDDGMDCMKLITKFLNDDGIENIRCYTNEMEALVSYIKDKPDFLIIDVQLENLSGFTLGRAIKSIDMFPPPILYISANRDNSSVDYKNDCYKSDFLPKPFNKKGLLSSVHRLLFS